MKLRYILVPLFGLAAALVVFLGFIMATETGLHMALDVATKLLPGTLRYERVTGRLISSLQLTNLHYQDGPLDLKLKQANLHWTAGKLLFGRLQINRLQADGITLQLPPPAPQQETQVSTQSIRLSDLPLPIQVTIDELRISDFRSQTGDAEQPFIVNEVIVQGRTEKRTVKAERIAVAIPQGRIETQGELTLSGDIPLTLRLTGRVQQPDYAPLIAKGTLQGTLEDSLDIQLATSGTVTTTLTGKVSNLLTDPDWLAQLTLNIADLGRFSPELSGNPMSAHLQTQGNLDDFQARGEINTHFSETGPLDSRFQLKGNRHNVQMEEFSVSAAEHPLSINLQADINLVKKTLDASCQWQGLAWPLTEQPDIESPQGQLALQGSLQDYTLEASAALASPDLGTLNARLQAAGSDQAVEVSQLAVRAPDSELSITARGKLSFADLAFQADGEWQALAWPVLDIPQIESPRGTFKADGNIKDYRFQMDTQVGGAAIPQGSWQIEGNGSQRALETLQVKGSVLEGTLKADISTRWQPTVSWRAALRGENLNPGAHWPDLPGQLTLVLTSQGQLGKDALRVTGELEKLSGTLRGQTVLGEGQVKIEDQNLIIPELSLRAGDARLAITGQLAEHWDMDWQLTVPALNQLLPSLAGTINSAGGIKGPRPTPRADFDLFIGQLAIGEAEIQRLEGNAALDSSGATRSQLTLLGENLKLGGQTWQSLDLEGTGTPAAHNLQGEFRGDPGDFLLALTGGTDQAENIWQGQLAQLEARDTLAGTWTLPQVVKFRITPQQVIIEQGCLTSTPATLCVQGGWNAETGATGRLELRQLDIQRFADLIPTSNIETDTLLSGVVAGATTTDGSIKGDIDVQLGSGKLIVNADDNPITITLGGGQFEAQTDGTNASATLALDAGIIGRLQAKAQIADMLASKRLNGDLMANMENLDIISVFVPMAQEISGQIQADLDFSGTLAAPAVGGSVVLKEGAVSLPEIAAQIENIELAAVSDGGGSLAITGSADAGPGQLQLSGELQTATGQLAVNLQGKDFQVANAPDLQALISPDLRFTLDESEAQINGQVTIPKAFLSPRGGGDANRVSASSDVVIISEEDEEAEPSQASGLPLFMQVRLILGEDVRVRAFEFQGNLAGDITVRQTPRSPLRGTGNIEVETGEYTLLGQRLKIERGRVFFNNTPLDNPNLDMRVTRSIQRAYSSGQPDDSKKTGGSKKTDAFARDDGTVIVGAQVTGTAKNPKLQLFSTPPMPESSILSYLTFGTAPEAVGEAPLTVGQYLTPDLWVGYRIGLFDALNTFVMRYRLSRRFGVEATTNSEQTGADVLYTIPLK